jgi:hypothetical protein
MYGCRTFWWEYYSHDLCCHYARNIFPLEILKFEVLEIAIQLLFWGVGGDFKNSDNYENECCIICKI